MQANKFSAANSTQKRTHLVKDQLLLHDPRVLFERGLGFAGSELAQAGWPVIWDREQSEKIWRWFIQKGEGNEQMEKAEALVACGMQVWSWPRQCVRERGDGGSPGMIFLFWLVTSG